MPPDQRRRTLSFEARRLYTAPDIGLSGILLCPETMYRLLNPWTEYTFLEKVWSSVHSSPDWRRSGRWRYGIDSLMPVHVSQDVFQDIEALLARL